MIEEKTYNAPVTSRTSMHKIEVYLEGGGGRVYFTTLEQLYDSSGAPIGIGDMTKHQANFVDLPATFPVIINGNIVQVAGSTILAALESVAKAVIAAQSP